MVGARCSDRQRVSLSSFGEAGDRWGCRSPADPTGVLREGEKQRINMNQKKRISANYVRKFIPGLKRINTPAGRRWTINGNDQYKTLQEVIDAFNHALMEVKKALEAMRDTTLTSEEK